MSLRTTFQTFLSRFLIMALNFGLIIFSTNIYGSGGKGIISLLTADLTMVMFATNVFAGSSVSYFASKYRPERILIYAYSWSVFLGVSIPFAFTLFRQQDYLFYLIGLSVFSALLSANINLFVGLRRMRHYNLYTLLQLVLHAVFLLVIVYVANDSSVSAYFAAQIAALVVLFAASSIHLRHGFHLRNVMRDLELSRQMFHYGWKTQLSSALQFLNNRLSYYFLEFFKGIASVGVFSVGVAFSEAIWMVSRSLAVVLYSDLVNCTDAQQAVRQTKVSLKISFTMTLTCVVVMLLIPGQFYTTVFGAEFSETRMIILFLTPGILAIAVSNIVGHYFSAMNKLKILNVKSLFGLVFTVPAMLYAVPRWGILGASAVTTISYGLSSAVLLWGFYKIADFSWRDFIFTSAEIAAFRNKIFP